MNRIETVAGDSLTRSGGTIPGTDGAPAFALRRPRPMPVPVLIAVPHAGRHYPEDLTQRMRAPGRAAPRLEDRYVDLVGEAVARETGAVLLVANAPRAMIDLNRSPEDVDWDMVATGKARPAARLAVGRRARSGLGLVPRRLPGLGELWNAPMDRADLTRRIDQVHKPYHLTLSKTLESMRDRWGAALLIDLHSMPPLGPKTGRDAAVDFVVGDRFGASCDSYLVAAALEFFGRNAASVAHNRPYAGGYVLDRHGAPARGLSAIQLEVCRSAYLDEQMREPGDGLKATVDLVTGLVRRLAGVIADGGMAQAAE